jgi:hypothetical protein
MSEDHKTLRSYADSLPDGPEKAEALEALAQIKRIEDRGAELQEQLNEIHARSLGSSKGDRIGCFTFFCVLAYFLVGGLYRGRFPNFFIKKVPYTYWSEEPFIFGFIAVFVGVLALVLLGIALGFRRIGRRPTIASTRRARTHARDA